MTSACVISDPEKGIKYPLFDNALYPDIAILDSSLVVSVPPAITANTGMDVLTHALEAYVSPRASDFTDALVEKAVQIVFQYLPTAVKKGDCLATRGKMHNASTLAGIAFSQAGLGLNHALAHQIGGQFHLPHGWRMRSCSRRLSALMLAIRALPNATPGWRKRAIYARTTPMTPPA